MQTLTTHLQASFLQGRPTEPGKAHKLMLMHDLAFQMARLRRLLAPECVSPRRRRPCPSKRKGPHLLLVPEAMGAVQAALDQRLCVDVRRAHQRRLLLPRRRARRSQHSQRSFSVNPLYQALSFGKVPFSRRGACALEVTQLISGTSYYDVCELLTYKQALGLDANAQGCKRILNAEAIQSVIKRGHYNKPRREQQATLYLSKQGKFTCKQRQGLRKRRTPRSSVRDRSRFRLVRQTMNAYSSSASVS